MKFLKRKIEGERFMSKTDKTGKIKLFFTKVNDKRNNVALIATAVTFIAMFMPFVTVSIWGYSESVNFMSGDDGKLVFVFILVAAIVYYLRREGIGCVMSAIVLFIVMFDFMRINDMYGLAKPGIGCYLMILGALAMVAAPFVGDRVEQAVRKKTDKNLNS